MVFAGPVSEPRLLLLLFQFVCVYICVCAFVKVYYCIHLAGMDEATVQYTFSWHQDIKVIFLFSI